MPKRKDEDLDQWAKDQHDWLVYQAPLRHTAYFDENATEEEKAEAERLLKESIQELTDKHPPLTGTFTYTQEQDEEAKKHGF